MGFSGFEIFWMFFFYSFAGWVLETVFATLKQKNFANRGWINGPFCITYGIGAVVISIALQGLDGIWLFLGIMIDTTVIEWIAGHLVERLYHERWWDYSGRKLNLDGYICLGASMMWGALGFVTVKWVNPLMLPIYHLMPKFLEQLVIWFLIAVLTVDILASYMLVNGRQGRLDRWEAANNQIANVSAKLGKWIAGHVEKRLKKAYPAAHKTEAVPREKEVFASGCGFYKLVVLFVVGSFLGDLVETVFCRFSLGAWMSRSSLVWGQFSIIWGFAIAGMTALLYKYKDESRIFLFFTGTFLGGAYEYCCSVLGEIVFGKIFWDYSKYPFNLGGRINLLFCFFWGIAAVIWFKLVYPAVTKWIERIPIRIRKAVTWFLAVFMAADMAVSALALIRYDQRDRGEPAEYSWQVYMDEHYDDEKMIRIYPKAKTPPEENRIDVESIRRKKEEEK